MKNSQRHSKHKRKPFKTNKESGTIQKLEKSEINNLKQQKDNIEDLNPEDIDKFDSLPLSKKTLKGLLDNGYAVPTKVQSQTLIHSLRGLDVVGAAKTGSGKTLAFIIPVLELLYTNSWTNVDGIGAIIITPNRELAYQIFEVLNRVGALHKYSAGLVIGGKDLNYEWSRISNCNILICTPGRLLQHMSENPAFYCDNVQILVLDEADVCLSMGFANTMNSIFEDLPSDRQTLLFSATQTKDVKDLIRAGCNNPIYCSVHENSKTVTPKSLQESYTVCEEQDKLSFLWSFLCNHKRSKTLVFLSTCKQVSFILDLFTHLRPGMTVMGLHGGMHQLRRMAVYDEFCAKKRAVLFATDVASRGLDIPSVNWVIQLDCPEDVTTYIHRAGRTARHTEEGECLLVLTPSQEEPMLEQMGKKNIKLENIIVDSSKLQDIQPKVDFILSKYYNMKEKAERAFKTYLKSVTLMKNKDVFKVEDIDMDSLARSLGLRVTPRVRFVEKRKSKKVESTDLVTQANKTYDLGIDKDDADEDFMAKSQKQPDYSKLTESKDVVADLLSFTRTSLDGLTKYGIAKKISKKNIKPNTKVVFDDEGNPQLESGSLLTNQKFDEGNSGIDIEAIGLRMKERDRLDKEANSMRIKEKRRTAKKKLEESRKAELEAEDQDISEEDDLDMEAIIDELPDPDDAEDVDIEDIIDELPDPNDEDVRKAKDSDSADSEDASELDGAEGFDDASRKTTKKKKRVFRGKLEAKASVREAKKAKIVAENDLTAISFKEKEDLALFLLKEKG